MIGLFSLLTLTVDNVYSAYVSICVLSVIGELISFYLILCLSLNGQTRSLWFSLAQYQWRNTKFMTDLLMRVAILFYKYYMQM